MSYLYRREETKEVPVEQATAGAGGVEGAGGGAAGEEGVPKSPVDQMLETLRGANVASFQLTASEQEGMSGNKKSVSFDAEDEAALHSNIAQSFRSNSMGGGGSDSSLGQILGAAGGNVGSGAGGGATGDSSTAAAGGLSSERGYNAGHENGGVVQSLVDKGQRLFLAKNPELLAEPGML